MTELNPHWGTTLDEFLAEGGILEDVTAEAVARVLACQLSQTKEPHGIARVNLPDRNDAK
nr:hypothetical protein [uncultured Rhodopila sp.]